MSAVKYKRNIKAENEDAKMIESVGVIMAIKKHIKENKMKKRSATDVKQLTSSLFEVYNELRAGNIAPKEAKTLSDVAGKVLQSVSVRMKYNRNMGNSKQIKELES